MGISLYMAESLHCSPEAVTALLIGDTPMQNEKLKKLDQFYFIEGFFFFLRKIIKNYEAKILCIITLFDSVKLLFNMTKWWDSFSKEIRNKFCFLHLKVMELNVNYFIGGVSQGISSISSFYSSAQELVKGS